MNERIKEIIEKSGLKKIEFAEKIKVHQSHITKIISGERNPSVRLIDDICDKIRIDGETINKEWIYTGEGNITIKRTRKQEISSFANEIIDLPDENIKKRLIEALMKLNERDWETIAKIADSLKEGS